MGRSETDRLAVRMLRLPRSSAGATKRRVLERVEREAAVAALLPADDNSSVEPGRTLPL